MAIQDSEIRGEVLRTDRAFAVEMRRDNAWENPGYFSELEFIPLSPIQESK